jgi:hypothetical protein
VADDDLQGFELRVFRGELSHLILSLDFTLSSYSSGKCARNRAPSQPLPTQTTLYSVRRIVLPTLQASLLPPISAKKELFEEDCRIISGKYGVIWALN